MCVHVFYTDVSSLFFVCFICLFRCCKFLEFIHVAVLFALSVVSFLCCLCQCCRCCRRCYYCCCCLCLVCDGALSTFVCNVIFLFLLFMQCIIQVYLYSTCILVLKTFNDHIVLPIALEFFSCRLKFCLLVGEHIHR